MRCRKAAGVQRRFAISPICQPSKFQLHYEPRGKMCRETNEKRDDYWIARLCYKCNNDSCHMNFYLQAKCLHLYKSFAGYRLSVLGVRWWNFYDNDNDADNCVCIALEYATSAHVCVIQTHTPRRFAPISNEKNQTEKQQQLTISPNYGFLFHVVRIGINYDRDATNTIRIFSNWRHIVERKQIKGNMFVERKRCN